MSQHHYRLERILLSLTGSSGLAASGAIVCDDDVLMHVSRERY